MAGQGQRGNALGSEDGPRLATRLLVLVLLLGSVSWIACPHPKEKLLFKYSSPHFFFLKTF